MLGMQTENYVAASIILVIVGAVQAFRYRNDRVGKEWAWSTLANAFGFLLLAGLSLVFG